jgi:hypothetical protein
MSLTMARSERVLCVLTHASRTGISSFCLIHRAIA